MNETENKKSVAFYKFLITQIVCIMLIIATVLITKYFFKETYKEFKKWYSENVGADTEISEIIGEKDEI